MAKRRVGSQIRKFHRAGENVVIHANRIRVKGVKAAAAFAIIGVLLLSATSAFAGVGISVTPGGAVASLLPGDTGLTGSIRIQWQNTVPNNTHANVISNILLTPSCGEFAGSAVCP